VAIGVAVVAALLLFNFVRGIEDSAYEGAERVEVYKADLAVPRGSEGLEAVNSGAIVVDQIPREFRPDTAISKTDEIAGKVALFNIAPGTVIVKDMFVDAATTQISFRQRLKNRDHVAITIQVDSVRGVGGFLVPGDEVNMMVFSENATGDGEVAGQPQLLGNSARYLYQDVQILAVGSTAQLEPGEAATAPDGTPTSAPAGGGSGILTLNVPPKAAQWIASFENSFYLTLNPEDYEPRPIEPLPGDVTLLPGEDPALLTPYCGLDGDGSDPCPPTVDGEG
jgi:Flp pilus assembly protein CpaB